MASAQLLDGKKVAASIRSSLKSKLEKQLGQNQAAPGLAVIVVGDNPASTIYVRNKRKACLEIGMHTEDYDLPENTDEDSLLKLINELNQNDKIHGILVQLPLPAHIDEYRVIDHIKPTKDVDGFHPYTLGRLTQRRPLLRPCTALGVITLLQYYDIDLLGINATVVGASNLVGRPMALELLLCGASVSVTHRFTKDLKSYVEQAQLLIVATGKMNVVHPDWIANNTIVVDVGIHRLDDGTVRGDLDYDALAHKAAWITPVPGGIGPMTIAMLLQNTMDAQSLTAP